MKNLNLKGQFKVVCTDASGNEKWAQDFNNGIVDEGIAYLLDLGFNAANDDISTWYIGLIGTLTTLAAGDTMASHSGWSEDQQYSESVRQTWGCGATAARSMTNATTADFSMNATTTINGIFITSSSTKGGTTGTLWSTAQFSSAASVTSGDTLKVTYTING